MQAAKRVHRPTVAVMRHHTKTNTVAVVLTSVLWCFDDISLDWLAVEVGSVFGAALVEVAGAHDGVAIDVVEQNEASCQTRRERSLMRKVIAFIGRSEAGCRPAV
ncbi:MAG: hypothetical protein ACI81R_003797, partial [Bradymonadia bacterium]